MNLIQANSLLSQIPGEGVLKQKWQVLVSLLAQYSHAVVAFSGGLDSSLLVYSGSLVYGQRMLAVMIQSEFETEDTITRAIRFVEAYQIPYQILTVAHLADPILRSNPPERCYFCKRSMLGMVWELARERGYPAVLDGQNTDDLKEYRPGMRAVAETGTISPLLASGINKAEIRTFSRVFALPSQDLESSPCLATRIPGNTEITLSALRSIAAGETFLRGLGFHQIRVRSHAELARIEIDPREIPRLAENRALIESYFKNLGYQYVTLDLGGYRQGSINNKESIP